MFRLTALLAAAAAASACAAIVNVEFNFTPFTGDLKTNHVMGVPGKARVFLNGIPAAEQALTKRELPVMFDNRQAGPALWAPAQSFGPFLRKGRNRIRIEFEPENPTAPYQSQVSWAEVNDAAVNANTNQSGEGMENRSVKGKMVFEREFQANFAEDKPWHHYPPVTALSDGDKQQLIAVLQARLDVYKPDFKAAYQLLTKLGLKGAEAAKAQCLELAYKTGVRFVLPSTAAGQFDFQVNANPVVVVQGPGGGNLYRVNDNALFYKIPDPKKEDTGMCAAFGLSAMFPPKMYFVKNPAGVWEPVM